jgi:hypothetical protein
MKHRVCINVRRKPVIKSGQRTIRSRILDLLFGKEVGVFVLTPGASVETVEIHEIGGGHSVGA